MDKLPVHPAPAPVQPQITFGDLAAGQKFLILGGGVTPATPYAIFMKLKANPEGYTEVNVATGSLGRIDDSAAVVPCVSDLYPA